MRRGIVAALMLLGMGMVARSAAPPPAALPAVSPRVWFLPLLLREETHVYCLPLITGGPERSASALALASPTAAASPTSAPAPSPDPAGCANLVHRQGDRLLLDGQPFVLMGVKAFSLMDPALPEAEIHKLLDAIAGWCATAIRIWVFPGADLDRFQRVLDLAAPRGLRFVVTLQDYYHYKDARWFSTFYKEKDLPHIQRLVTRFRDRPEIAVWEVMNEPWCGANNEFSDPHCYRILQAWAEDTTGLIRRLDPCRPISLGTMGVRHTPLEAEAFRRLHTIDTVDIVSMHRVPQDWYTHPQELDIARELGKPVMIGEVWVMAYKENCSPISGDAVRQRAERLDQDMRKALELGVDGYLLWNFAPGLVTSKDGQTRFFCGVNDYFRDDPVGPLMRALPIRRPAVRPSTP